jgi:hypothetical protein
MIALWLFVDARADVASPGPPRRGLVAQDLPAPTGPAPARWPWAVGACFVGAALVGARVARRR